MFHPGFGRWGNDSRGNLAVFFALLVTPLLMVVGFAIDSSRRVNSEWHVQFAVDAATLAGARALEDATMTEGDVKPIVSRVFFANLNTSFGDLSCADPDVSVDRDAETVTVGANCDVPTIFGTPISGREILPIANTATAKADLTKFELVMMLDLSFSMRGTRMTDLKAATNYAVSSIADNFSGDRIRVALVPYATYVNAGAYGNRAQGKTLIDDSDDDGLQNVCVIHRDGIAELRDDGPAPGTWIGDYPDPIDCAQPSIVPLTTDATKLRSVIDALVPLEGDAGGTSGHIAIAWSWYLLSSKWNSVWPTASHARGHNDPNVEKIAIIMTDGGFNGKYLDLGIWDRDAWIELLENSLALCAAMRDQGITIYTIGFNVSSPASSHVSPYASSSILRTCAGSDANYYPVASGEELHSVYAEIVDRLIGTGLTN